MVELEVKGCQDSEVANVHYLYTVSSPWLGPTQTKAAVSASWPSCKSGCVDWVPDVMF